MSDQKSEQQQVDASAAEERIQEVIDGVTKKGKKKKRQLKLEKGILKKTFKEYQFQFLLTLIAIVVIIILLTISYKTNPYINDNQEGGMVCKEVISLIE
ncbi:hypothetical protein [Amphibacillus indicireducens]|uniref:Uncharacterized protein n=1 Tax=Amphibacillus indicireducens TaxID=1076330 RepID=A0ABP7VRK3_9BACI